MELLLLLGSVAAAAGGAALLLYRGARLSALAQLASLRAAAEIVGLTETRASWARMGGPRATLVGRSGVLRVALSTAPVGSSGRIGEDVAPRFSKTIAIDGMGHRPGDLEIAPESFGTGVGKVLGARELTLGDPSFDQCIYLRGSEPLIYALFDCETRRLVAQLFIDVDAEVSLADGTLQVTLQGAADGPEALAEKATSALEVARRLARPADVASRLALNAREDPAAAMRMGSLAVLTREYAGRPATTRVLHEALEDPITEVRLHAATALGPDGRETLLAIAAAERGEQDAVSAIEALGEHLPRERAEVILRHALRTRRLPVAAACLAALGQCGGVEVVPLLSKVLAVERGWLTSAAARALGDTGEASAERPLLAALDRTDEDVALAAAKALSQAGTASAVPRLRAVESSTSVDELRRAAREAIARIHERLTGADPGQLSLAGGESGQLSLTEDERGRVTLPPDTPDDGALRPKN